MTCGRSEGSRYKVCVLKIIRLNSFTFAGSFPSLQRAEQFVGLKVTRTLHMKECLQVTAGIIEYTIRPLWLRGKFCLAESLGSAGMSNENRDEWGREAVRSDLAALRWPDSWRKCQPQRCNVTDAGIGSIKKIECTLIFVRKVNEAWKPAGLWLCHLESEGVQITADGW